MMRNKRSIWAAGASLAACALLLSCTPENSRMAGPGTGSETTNTISGILMLDSANAAPGVTVYLSSPEYASRSSALTKRSAFNAKFRDSTLSDAIGHFRFDLDGIDSGSLVLEAIADSSHALILPIVKDPALLDLGKVYLQATGSISGQVHFPLGDMGGFLLQVLGTGRNLKKDSSQSGFSLTGLPPGTYMLRTYGVEPKRDTVLTTVQVEAGKVTSGVVMQLGETNPPWLKAGWILTFQDEFDGTALDTASKWVPRDESPTIRNQELQAVVPEALSVGGGALNITAEMRKADYAGALREYTSGMAITKGRFSQQYGLVEIRCRWPDGPGLRSSVWMLQDTTPQIWPPELMIASHQGSLPDSVDMNLGWMQGTTRKNDFHRHALAPASDGFHLLSCEWDSASVRWSLDGVLQHEYHGPDAPKSPLYLLFDLTVGGTFEPQVQAAFPAVFAIDYIRVYRRAP